MRPDKDRYLMELARVAATRTTCIRKGVGCVLADSRGRVLAIAYNGVAAGLPHCNEQVDKPVYHDDPRVSYDHFDDQFVFSGTSVARLRALDLVRPAGESRLTWPLHEDGADQQCVGHDTAWPHACPGHNRPFGEPTSCGAVHAEQNAVLQCRDPDAIRTAYVTTAPCKPCAKLLLNTGCTRIVFVEEHPGMAEAAELWTDAGRRWDMLKVQEDAK